MMALFIGTSFSSMVTPKFEIEIIQDDEILDIDEDIVMLEKAPFTIRVKVYEMEGIFMNASTDPKMFELGKEGKIMDFAFISSKTMNEAPENAARDLILSDGYYTYLAYNAEDGTNSFDQLEAGEGYFTGFRAIDKLSIKGEDKPLNFKKNKKDIYLFFITTTPDHKSEIGRFRVKLQWK